jgi:hypothetical protein
MHMHTHEHIHKHMHAHTKIYICKEGAGCEAQRKGLCVCECVCVCVCVCVYVCVYTDKTERNQTRGGTIPLPDIQEHVPDTEPDSVCATLGDVAPKRCQGSSLFNR